MKKIFIVIGTRPEAIKSIPVYLELKKHFDVQIISTGQHLEMLQRIFDFFSVVPDYSLRTMVANQSLAGLTSSLLNSVSKVFESNAPDLVIVQGDTTTAMVTAMVSYYHQIPVAHIEAGLRSNNLYAPFPEEVNRKIISQIAELNFAPTREASENLWGCRGVHVVGNTIVDSLLLTLEQIKRIKQYDDRFPFLEQKKDLVLVTAHRRESFGSGIRNICDAIKRLSDRHPMVQFVYPVHMNPNIKQKVFEYLGKLPSVVILDPVDYGEMVYLMKCAKLILTDSGGIQEEAPALNVPVIVMRDVTERPEGIAAGCAVLSGTQTEGIIRAFDQIYTNPDKYEAMRGARNPYGDGKSAQRITAIIRGFL